MNRPSEKIFRVSLAIFLLSLVLGTVADAAQGMTLTPRRIGIDRVVPSMWDQWGPRSWRKFQYTSLPFGFYVKAGDLTNDGTSYVCNRAIGYPFVYGALPMNLWFGGKVWLYQASQSGNSWTRMAFVIAVDYGDHEDFLELDVYESPNSPILPGKPCVWPTVREYDKYQLQPGQNQTLLFNIAQEYRSYFPDRNYTDVKRVHLYFVLECQTAYGSGWSVSYAVDDMGYRLEST